MITPLVSVIMPVYNAEQYLKEAIESILNQTFSEFEFIIIDDKSTDKTLQIIKSFNDARIKIFENQTNLGTTKSLNIGLKHAKAKYIARMDADDISVFNRLEKQVLFLEMNVDYCLVGSYAKIIPGDYILKIPVTDAAIRANMLFSNPFIHPSVMIRSDILKKNNVFYNENLKYAQDEELWFRISKHGKLYNIPEVLLFYRVHDRQISSEKKSLQKEYSEKLKVMKISEFFDNNLKVNTEFIRRLLDNNIYVSKNDYNYLKDLVGKIYRHNKITKKISHKYLRNNLANIIIKYLNKIKERDVYIYLKTFLLFLYIGKFPLKYYVKEILNKMNKI